MTPDEQKSTSVIPYALAIESIMYAMLCMQSNVSYASTVTSMYQLDFSDSLFTVLNNILKYFRRNKDVFLVSGDEDELDVNGLFTAPIRFNCEPQVHEPVVALSLTLLPQGFSICVNKDVRNNLNNI